MMPTANQLNVNTGSAEEANKVRICVIGAGPAGLMTLRALQSLDVNKFDVTCYERYAEVGGMWNFRPVEGLEEDGMERHSTAYYGLVANSSKYFEECPEFPFHKYDASKDTGFECFPSWDDNVRYMNEFTDHFGIRKNIRFKSWIESVKFNSQAEKFDVKVKNLAEENGRDVLEVFDYVIVGTGHYHEPNYITYPGQETFPGKILHAKYFHDAERYNGKRVLLVGSNFSAEDFACLLVKAQAAKVTVSARTQPIMIGLPKEVDLKRPVKNIEGTTIK